MDVLWERGKATVNEVADALPAAVPLAYSTVLTTLRILERKGYVRHIKEGRAFVYEAVVGRGEASRSAIRYVLSRFFRNSPELLVLNMLEDEQIDSRELERLKGLIERSK
jgi:BlaI family transcriptional regulator, penicillinase repressor